MIVDKIPDFLKQNALWCVWKREENGKIPYNPQIGKRAQPNNPETFSDFQTAYEAYVKGGYDGLGIGIFNNIGAIDIDDCIVDGVFSDIATYLVNQTGSYTEISPSGKGIRIIFIVNDDFVYDKELYYINNRKLGLEIYVSGATSKFVTITGNIINENPIIDGTLKLTEILNK